MPPPKLGARRACHSLFALGGRHHDGTGCGWGGAGGAEVEMFPLPTLKLMDKVSGKELGPPPTRRLTLATESYHHDTPARESVLS